MQEIPGSGIEGERFNDLLGGPFGGWTSGRVEMNDPTSMMGKHNENEEHLEVHCRHDEEVDGDKLAQMIFEESLPGRRRWPSRADPIHLDGRFSHFNGFRGCGREHLTNL